MLGMPRSLLPVPADQTEGQSQAPTAPLVSARVGQHAGRMVTGGLTGLRAGTRPSKPMHPLTGCIVWAT